ncbi:hypothetical protein pb186bvf_016411 [Paramecium bursaria]
MSKQENSLINQQVNQSNQELIQQPQQQVYPQQNQQQQNSSSQIIAQQINFDQQNLQQQQLQFQQQQFQQQQQQQPYQQPQHQFYNNQVQMQPQLYQQQYPPQQYYQQQPQYVNNDVNQGQQMVQGQQIVQGFPQQPMVQQIPQGQPIYKQKTVVPLLYEQPNNAVLSLQPSNTLGQEVLVINDNTLRSADGFRFPTTIICETCNIKGQTIIQKESSQITHIFAVILCIACPPLCIAPYALQECDNIQHYCILCKSKAGAKNYKLCDSY